MRIKDTLLQILISKIRVDIMTLTAQPHFLRTLNFFRFCYFLAFLTINIGFNDWIYFGFLNKLTEVIAHTNYILHSFHWPLHSLCNKFWANFIFYSRLVNKLIIILSIPPLFMTHLNKNHKLSIPFSWTHSFCIYSRIFP